MNKLFLIGNLTRDPEMSETATGVAFCRLGVVLGFHFLSVVGVLITLCLIGEILLLRHLLKGTTDSRETQN